jgi:hypothetical protein
METDPVNRNCLTSPQLIETGSDTASQAPADADVAKSHRQRAGQVLREASSVRTSTPHKTELRS